MEQQIEIARTLGRIGPAATEAIPVLRQSLPDTPVEFSNAINEAIRQIEGKAIAPAGADKGSR
jgi:hypothetical protein